MRLATWNVNSLTARLPRVTEWIEEHQPDVLCMQETKQADAKFPADAFADLGYESAHHGDGRWNGVAMVSRVGLSDRCGDSAAPRGRARLPHRGGHCGGVRVHSVYVPNGRSLDNEFYVIKLEWLARLRTIWMRRVPPGARWRCAATSTWPPTTGTCGTRPHFVGMTHVSEPERAALRQVEAWGLDDVFPRFNEPGVVHVVGLPGRRFPPGPWGAHRPDPGQRRPGRTGHRRFMDRDARKGKKPSDHAPVVVDFADA